MDTLLTYPSLLVVVALSGAAALSDLRTGLIPNELVLGGAVAAVLAQLLSVALGHVTWGGALSQLGLGFAAGTLLPLALHAGGALGGGDVKLFAAIGLCVGPQAALGIQFWSQLIAAGFLALQLLVRGGLLQVLRTSGRMFLNLFRPRSRRKPIDRARLTSMRFAPAIFAAVLWVCTFTEYAP